jgi:hyaluronan synthase
MKISISHVELKIAYVEYAPKTAKCPTCGTISKRHRKGKRAILDIEPNRPVLINATIGVYSCNKCSEGEKKYFTIELPFAAKGAKYTYRAQERCAALKDKMSPLSVVPAKTSRSFHVKPSKSTVHRWLSQEEKVEKKPITHDYKTWITNSFHGIICVDELHNIEYPLIFTVHPESGKKIAYQLEELSGEHQARFLDYLKNIGIDLEFIIEDDKTLYPKDIKELWAKAKNQLYIPRIGKEMGRTESILLPEKPTLPVQPKPKEEERPKVSAPAEAEEKVKPKNFFPLLLQAVRDGVVNALQGVKQNIQTYIDTEPTKTRINNFKRTIGVHVPEPIPTQKIMAESRPPKPHRISIPYLVGFFIVMGVVIGFISYIIFYTTHSFFCISYTIVVITYVLSRFLLSALYTPPKDVGYEPAVSVIVPVKNEEDYIGDVLRCCLNSDYPKEKLEVIVIDDGSDDNTWKEIMKLKEEYPGDNLITIKFDKNRGKRDAMGAGFDIAKGEVFITIDSDTFLYPDSIRSIVQGFDDPEVAAISGHTEVGNRSINFLTRMQTLLYFVAYKLVKTGESIFGAVSCCPGCFSAFRREPLLEVIDEWTNPKPHFGILPPQGDDRSLTNLILMKHKIIYASNAIATTVVPENPVKLVKQNIRWTKSWFIDSVVALTFIYKKPFIAFISFYASFFLVMFSPVITVMNLVWLPVVYNIQPYIYIIGLALVAYLHGFHFRALVRARWIVSSFILMIHCIVFAMVLPYSLIRIGDMGWGTR